MNTPETNRDPYTCPLKAADVWIPQFCPLLVDFRIHNLATLPNLCKSSPSKSGPDPAAAESIINSKPVLSLSNGSSITNVPPWPVGPWLQLNCAKQTQFPKAQNQHNRFQRQDLREKAVVPGPKKTNPIKPSFPPRYASRLTRYE